MLRVEHVRRDALLPWAEVVRAVNIPGPRSGGGQPITQDDMRRRLELIMEVAQEIWGNT